MNNTNNNIIMNNNNILNNNINDNINNCNINNNTNNNINKNMNNNINNINYMKRVRRRRLHNQEARQDRFDASRQRLVNICSWSKVFKLLCLQRRRIFWRLFRQVTQSQSSWSYRVVHWLSVELWGKSWKGTREAKGISK